MSIPDKAVEAAARSIRPDLWADPDLRLATEHQKNLEFQRSVVMTAARAGLEAAEPHLTPDPEVLRAGIEAHRMASPGTAWKDASCKCGWTGLDYWPHQTAMILSLLADHPEVKS